MRDLDTTVRYKYSEKKKDSGRVQESQVLSGAVISLLFSHFGYPNNLSFTFVKQLFQVLISIYPH